MKNKSAKVLLVFFLLELSVGINYATYGVEGRFAQYRFNKPDFENTQNIESVFRYYLSFLGENISFSIIPRGVLISINSDIFFEDNDVELGEYSKQILVIFAELLKYVDKQCLIESNTLLLNREGSIYNSHQEISIARADSVAKYLISTQSISPDRIRTIGFGEKIPFYKSVINYPQMLQRIDFVVLNYEKFKQ